jgi:putative alpha-1,2-mannosidase
MRWQKTAYYSSKIDKYDIKAEFTASKRVGVSRFTFPKGNLIFESWSGFDQ